MNRRDPMRPHPLELPLVWVPINVLMLFVALAVARGLTQPGSSSVARYAILAVCLVVAASFLYAIRRRFIPR